MSWYEILGIATIPTTIIGAMIGAIIKTMFNKLIKNMDDKEEKRSDLISVLELRLIKYMRIDDNEIAKEIK